MMSPGNEVRFIGRYALHGELASGGMAAVHLGRLLGPVGFARTVAIKRLHSHHSRDPEFVKMFLDEARIVSRIKHPNVVPTLDVVALEGELFLVMEYVHGMPVSKIMMALGRRKERMPANIAVAIACNVLEGLHAAHEAKSEEGLPLNIVHRDVSPQNVIVGTDGIARVLDFGIAKAAERLQVTEDGSFKGKLGYMPPDVLSGAAVDRRADVWGTAVVLWEMLVGRRLFMAGESPHALVRAIVEGAIEMPSRRGVEIPPQLEAVLERGLMKDPNARYATARDMGTALEEAVPVASSRVIGEWLGRIVGEDLQARAAMVEQMERSSRVSPPSESTVATFTDSSNSLPFISTSPAHVEDPTSSATPRAIANLATAPSAAPSPVPAPAPRRGRLVSLVLVLVAIAAMGGGFVVWLRSARPTMTTTTGAPSPTPSQTAPRIETSAAAPAVSNIASAAPTTSASSPSQAFSGIPSATPSASVSASAAPRPPASAKTPPITVRSAAPKSCNPPYTIGPPPDYIRKPKLECLPQ